MVGRGPCVRLLQSTMVGVDVVVRGGDDLPVSGGTSPAPVDDHTDLLALPLHLGAVVVATAAFTVVVAAGAPWELALPAILLECVLMALFWNRPAVRSVALLGLLLSVLALTPLMLLWPLPLLLALLIFVGLTRVSALSWDSGWLRPGRLSGSTWWLIAGVVPVSIVVLALWYAVHGAELEGQAYYRQLLNTHPWWILALMGAAFVVVNAACEELLFCGVVQTAATRTSAIVGVGILVQCLFFGLIHYQGFPSGVLGIVLAACYGVLLGVLRLRSGGLVAPWLAHMCADVTIVCLLLASETFSLIP